MNNLIFFLALIANVTLLAQDYTIISVAKDEIVLSFDVQVDASDYMLNVWSSQEGLKDYDLIVDGDEIRLTFEPYFKAGDLIHLTTIGFKDLDGNTFPKKSFKEFIPVYQETTAFMDTIDTGIVLPENSLDFHRHLGATDLDKNGLTDFVFRYHVAYGDPTNVVTYLQNPDGTFTENSYVNNDSHSALRGTPDFNNDGYPDIFVVHNVPSKAHIRLNNGDGTFSEPAYYNLSSYSAGALPADVDSDGDLDIVGFTGISSLSSNRLSVLFNNGDGTFQPEKILSTDGSFLAGFEIADLDADGDIDIVKTGKSSFSATPRLQVYSNNGDGEFTMEVNETAPFSRWLRDIRDMDNDGHLDVFMNVPSMSIIKGDGNLLNYSLQDTVLASGGTGGARIADFDGDHNLDIYDLSCNCILLYDGTSYNALDSIGINQNFHGLAFTDFERDGDIDYFYVNEDRKLKLLLNNTNVSSVDKDLSFTLEFDLFPNPSSGTVFLTSKTLYGKADYQVYTIDGELLEQELLQGKVELELIPGIYIVKVISEGISMVKKLIVE